MTRMPAKNENCCAVACASPFRACTACLGETGVRQPDAVRQGGAHDGLCSFHAEHGASVRRPDKGSDEESVKDMCARLRRRVTLASAPVLSASREQRYEKAKIPVAERAAELVKQLKLANWPHMLVAVAVEKMNVEWSMSKEKIAPLLSITPDKVTQYKNLNYLVPEVQVLVDKLGVWAGAEISYARKELQLAIATRFLQRTLSVAILDSYIRNRDVRDPSRRMVPMEDED